MKYETITHLLLSDHEIALLSEDINWYMYTVILTICKTNQIAYRE